ncbi:MAG: DUF1080 domain-containing protein [Planctomycetota bacterium]|nr:DUF1080 domain-containing protein [Planctomycetota bacterium]
MRPAKPLRCVIVLALLLVPSIAAAELSLGSLFKDHGVLQREMAVPVWGTAEAGQQVEVQFAGQTKQATADDQGNWSAKLDAMPASAEGRTLTVTVGDEEAMVDDVLVGEVWICSGQSNMAFGLNGSVNGPATIAAAGDAQLRLFAAGAHAVDEPQATIRGDWQVDSLQSASNFSAVGYYFGKHLREHLGVPVGLIKSAVGGTVAEAWIARADLERNPTLLPLLEQQAERVKNYPQVLEAYTQREPELLKKHEAALAKAKATGTNPPRKPQPPQHPSMSNNRPSGLYNGSIAPLQPFAIRGAIWYQGESNSGRGEQYRTLFPAMIGSWRKAWGQGDFPFYFVQITPHQGMSPEIREAQRLTTETTQNTAMAVTIDIGHPTDIHPKQKQPIGERLGLAARALTYGEDIEYSGPTYDSISVDGSKATLTMKHLGGGLVAKDGDLKGFTVAGSDGNFVAASATIEGDKVIVFSDSVAEPSIVRYGWSNVPDINLYNLSGLPASPFQSDRAYEMEADFEPLLNETDLTGWHYENGEPFDGKQHASDGRYTARDGRIVVNPGKGLAQLWTTREFPSDFHLKLEFRAGVDADSGIFLRKPQLQCRDYLVAGPYKELKQYRPQDWNEIDIVVKGDVATCACNGEPLEFTRSLPPSGPIGLEADRGQMEYRRIRIKVGGE